MSREAYAEAIGELIGYVEQPARARRVNRGDDLLSVLTSAFDSDPELDPAQLTAVVLLLLVAGQETTASMIALGALALISQPEAAAALGDDDTARVTVEELLRYPSMPSGCHVSRPRMPSSATAASARRGSRQCSYR